MITRRVFLIGVGAGLTLSLFDKYFSYIESYGEPLLEAPDCPENILYAYTNMNFKLGLNGHPYEADFPYESWLEYLMEVKSIQRPTRMSHFREIFFRWNVKPSELEEPIPIDIATAYMEKTGPGADAHDLLKHLDIGPELELNKGEVGGLSFYSVPTPIDNFCGVEVDNLISLSILQHRLNQLGKDIGIRLAIG